MCCIRLLPCSVPALVPSRLRKAGESGDGGFSPFRLLLVSALRPTRVFLPKADGT